MRTALIAASLSVLVTVSGGPALSHSWYPSDCCDNRDCAPVQKVEYVPRAKVANMFGTSAYASPADIMLVTTKYGTVVVPPNFPRRQSQDSQMHACILESDGVTRYGDETDVPPRGTKRLLCIFMPPGN